VNAFRITRLVLAGLLVALVGILMVQSSTNVPDANATVGGGAGGDLLMIPSGMGSKLEILYVIDTQKRYMSAYTVGLAGVSWVGARRIDYDFQFPLAGYNDESKLSAPAVKKQVETATKEE
jgi:hypothetical protein